MDGVEFKLDIACYKEVFGVAKITGKQREAIIASLGTMLEDIDDENDASQISQYVFLALALLLALAFVVIRICLLYTSDAADE